MTPLHHTMEEVVRMVALLALKIEVANMDFHCCEVDRRMDSYCIVDTVVLAVEIPVVDERAVRIKLGTN